MICSAKTTPQNYTYHCQKSPLFKQHYFSSVRDPSRGENMPRHKTPEMKHQIKFINFRTQSEKARIVQISLSSRIKWARGYGKRRCCFKKRDVSWWREADVENFGELARFSRAFYWLLTGIRNISGVFPRTYRKRLFADAVEGRENRTKWRRLF